MHISRTEMIESMSRTGLAIDACISRTENDVGVFRTVLIVCMARTVVSLVSAMG